MSQVPQRYLFDDRGDVWRANAIELRRRLFCLDHPGDITPDLIRNLGFIGLETRVTGAQLRVHRRTVSMIAMAGVMYWLRDNLDRGGSRVAIRFEDEPSETGVLVPVETAISYLSNVAERVALDRQVRATHLRLDSLAAHDPLHAIFGFWRERNGRCDVGELMDASRAAIGARCVAVAAEDLRILDVGDGFQVPDAQWLATARRNRLDEHPDPIYRRWAVACYRNAASSWRPDLADIDAEIYWPSAGRVRRAYRRLLMPCLSPTGVRYLFGANANPLAVTSLLKVG